MTVSNERREISGKAGIEGIPHIILLRKIWRRVACE